MLADVNKPLNDTPNRQFLFNRKAPSTALQVSVIVPVRNEADQLVQTLDALRNQVDAAGQPLDQALYEVLLLANNCTDGSFAIAERYQNLYPNFPLHLAQIQLPNQQANIGTVRRLLMDEACRRLLHVGHENGIIASTDGDTEVDSRWLWHIINEINSGCDAVAGRIIARTNNNPARIFHLRNVTYRQLVAQVESLLDPFTHDPWPRHFQHFGASLAVTCRMYLQAGRLPEVPYLEDEAFYQALVRTDARIRKSTQVKVYTSSRLQGRVEVGFSEQLRYWANMHANQQVQLVEPPGALFVKFQNRRRLRALWEQRYAPADALLPIARELGISEKWLQRRLTAYAYFGQFWEKVAAEMTTKNWASRWKPIPITEAIQELRSYLLNNPSLSSDK